MEETKNIGDQSNLNPLPAEGDATASPLPPDQPEKNEGAQINADLKETQESAEISVPPIETKDQEPPTPEKLELEIAEIADRILLLIGIRSSIRAKIQEDGSFYVNIRSRNSDGLLIGKRGMTIVSIQAMVNQIMKHRYPTMFIDIFVDVSGYRKRRENFLKKKALAVARIVIDTNREMALDMLTEREFRMVEKEIIPLGTVRVYGVGSGSKRTVVIAPL